MYINVEKCCDSNKLKKLCNKLFEKSDSDNNAIALAVIYRYDSDENDGVSNFVINNSEIDDFGNYNFLNCLLSNQIKDKLASLIDLNYLETCYKINNEYKDMYLIITSNLKILIEFNI